jgi:hypothetical protein
MISEGGRSYRVSSRNVNVPVLTRLTDRIHKLVPPPSSQEDRVPYDQQQPVSH